MKLKTPYKLGLLFAGLGVLVFAALFAARVITYTNGYFGRHTLDLALIRAVEEDDHTLVRTLLAIGASPDFVMPGSGGSAVTAAAFQRDIWALRKLLEHGANPDGADVIVDNFGDPDKQIAYTPGAPMPVYYMDRPILWAARQQNHEAVALLREHGAKYEFVDALFAADEEFARNALESDSKLREALPGVRAQLLRTGVEFGNIPAIELMLELGFDPNETSTYGDSAFDLAKGIRRNEIVDLFESRADRGPVPLEK